MHRRSCLIPLALAVLCAGKSPALFAQPYPARPIRLLVPFEPAGTVDVLARIVARLMAEDLGRTVLVESRSGAGGIVGTSAAVRAEPDGYTLVVGSAALANQAFGRVRLPYDAQTDLSPVTPFATTPFFVLVNSGAPAQTLAELISSAKSVPGKLTYASSGAGSPTHLAGVRFAVATGTSLLHVPYRGTGPAINDLIAGHVDMMFVALPTAAIYLKFARLKALAVAAPARVSLLPEVPAFAEAGGPEFNVSSWLGILAPRGTPHSIRARLAASVHRALGRAEIVGKFALLGALPFEQSVEDFEASYAAEFEKARLLLREHPELLD